MKGFKAALRDNETDRSSSFPFDKSGHWVLKNTSKGSPFWIWRTIIRNSRTRTQLKEIKSTHFGFVNGGLVRLDVSKLAGGDIADAWTCMMMLSMKPPGAYVVSVAWSSLF